jgi:hypothetical protein
MKRLNSAELDARINKFLTRKFAEFPDLNENDVQPDRIWHGTRRKLLRRQPSVRHSAWAH